MNSSCGWSVLISDVLEESMSRRKNYRVQILFQCLFWRIVLRQMWKNTNLSLNTLWVEHFGMLTFVLLLRRPHTWQNLQRLQHQFSLFSSLGRSSGERQKLWKGSQQIWQNIIWWEWETTGEWFARQCWGWETWTIQMWTERFILHANGFSTSFSNLGYLVSSFTGTEQTDGLWSCRDRREDTEATH